MSQEIALKKNKESKKMDNKNIQDVKPLTFLEKLKFLYLEKNNIKNASPLSYLSKCHF